MSKELVHTLKNSFFVDMPIDFLSDLFRKHLFQIHFNRNQSIEVIRYYL